MSPPEYSRSNSNCVELGDIQYQKRSAAHEAKSASVRRMPFERQDELAANQQNGRTRDSRQAGQSRMPILSLAVFTRGQTDDEGVYHLSLQGEREYRRNEGVSLHYLSQIHRQEQRARAKTGEGNMRGLPFRRVPERGNFSRTWADAV